MTHLALCDVRGLLADLNEKLSGENAGEWHAGLKKFLRKENPWEVPSVKQFPQFPVFKTLTLGGLHKSPKDYHKALESAGFRIGNYAGQVLKKISIARAETEVDLVLVTAAELGFKDGARRDAIYARAIELGLKLCPAEVALALRLADSEDPWVVVGMKPVADSDGNLFVFYVNADGNGWWLDCICGSPGDFWPGEVPWVFVRPRK